MGMGWIFHGNIKVQLAVFWAWYFLHFFSQLTSCWGYVTFPNLEVGSHSRPSSVITHTATTHTLDAKFNWFTWRNTSPAGQTLGLCSGWPSCIWLQPQGVANGNLCPFLHRVASGTSKPPCTTQCGEPPLGRLSSLCKCRAVRPSLACNKGRFTKQQDLILRESWAPAWRQWSWLSDLQ